MAVISLSVKTFFISRNLGTSVARSPERDTKRQCLEQLWRARHCLDFWVVALGRAGWARKQGPGVKQELRGLSVPFSLSVPHPC